MSAGSPLDRAVRQGHGDGPVPAIVCPREFRGLALRAGCLLQAQRAIKRAGMRRGEALSLCSCGRVNRQCSL